MDTFARGAEVLQLPPSKAGPAIDRPTAAAAAAAAVAAAAEPAEPPDSAPADAGDSAASPATADATAASPAQSPTDGAAAGARLAPSPAAAAAAATKAPAAGDQPFHEAAAGQLAAAPDVPSVSDATARADEKARGVNFRDLRTVSSRIQPGRVYRSSQVVSARELEQLGVAAVLDLRQPPVGCKTDTDNLWRWLRHSARRWLGWLLRLGGGGGDSEGGAEDEPPPCSRCTSDCCEHYGVPARVYHVDLLPHSVSFRILWELPRSIQARVLWAALRRKHPEPIVAGAVADPRVMGYLRLYQILLERAQPRLAGALRLAADPANLPLLAHCIHGKDRTGLVAMLLLLLCGVEREAVVRDYALSEALLRESREKRELLGLQEYLTTDQVIAAAVEVMSSTIEHIEGRYGSAHNYLRAIGLTAQELEAIVHNLTAPGLALPAGGAGQACDIRD